MKEFDIVTILKNEEKSLEKHLRVLAIRLYEANNRSMAKRQ